MYPRFAFGLLFSVCAFGLGIAIPAFPVDKCGPNAEYKQCGSACVPDCSHPEPYKICTMQCIGGCFCKEGYLKNNKGECVLREQCDKTHPQLPFAIPMALDVKEQCPDNEEFRKCGSACPATCANPNAPDQPCTRQCVIGCFCKEGYMRNSHGVCVSAANCEAPHTNVLFAYPPEVSQCKENQVFMPCGSACAPTCANPRPGPYCTLQCIIGCFCKPGYLKNDHGVCVPSEQCGIPAALAVPLPPAICSENEEYRQCKGCDGTCQNPDPICPKICIPGCACKQGHLRDGNGRCMPIQNCPHVQLAEFVALPPNQCGENEVFHTCGTACPATCANPNARDKPCTRQCVIGCFCKEGFMKNANGQCVPAAMCNIVAMVAEPVHKCPTDREHYIDDPIGAQLDCLASCGAPLTFLIHGEPQVSKRCQEVPRKPACVCKKPYIRNSEGKCVETSECDKTNPFPNIAPAN